MSFDLSLINNEVVLNFTLEDEAAADALAAAARAESAKVGAETAEDGAAVSASQAAASASDALDSEQSAEASKQTAITQTGIATTKANEASQSAQTASTQAGIATTKANEASQSASQALSSKNEASNSESNALQSANTATAQAVIATDKAVLTTQKADLATIKANEASQSASNALASKNEAATSEQVATEKANIATTKANEASTSASNALASEQAAENSKQGAITQAGIATTKANEASQSASTASTQAGIATTKANEASQSAQTASTQAGIATTKANEASTSASNASTQAGIATTKASEAAASASLADTIINQGVYGVQWDATLATTVLTRIGDMAQHNALTGLPVQRRMRRCLLLESGVVNYYLDPNNSNLKLDGSAAILDGTDGQVMVEIPEHWRRFDTDGNIRRALISEAPFRGSHRVPTYYVSAYEASVQRSTNKLSSVINLSTDYRGGNNNAALDAQPNSQLGMPATSISRINFLAFARNRGANWHCYLYEVHKAIFWLFTIEYATRNSQLAFNDVLDANNYRQGGLGVGVTNMNSSAWNTFNGYYPIITCGAGAPNNLTSQTPITHPTLGSTNIPQYRGIEHPFGHLWKWTEGINIRAGNSRNMAYKANSFNFQSANYSGYTYIGDLATVNNFIRDLIFGSNGEMLPNNTTGAGSTTFWADYLYQSIPASGESLRGLLLGGAANNGSNAGLVCSTANYEPSFSVATVGSRLCFANTMGA